MYSYQLLTINLKAICREFLPHLDEEHCKAEQVRLNLNQDLDSHRNLTPKKCEAQAKPTDAGLYWKKWNSFRAAKHLFADKVVEIDSNSRDKTKKKEFGKYTIAINAWFNGLPESKLKEAEEAAAKWNSEGASDKEKMQM